MKLIYTVPLLLSLNAFANANYDKNCATRYINATVHLVDIAEQFNNGLIGASEYAAKVNYVDSTRLALGLYCLNESNEAIDCIRKTKPVYKKVRQKMQVTQVLKKRISRVKVSKLDLIGLRVATETGEIRGIIRDKENICVMD